jgi:adenylate cyclase
MYIIFGHEQATQLATKYTVLELDTIQMQSSDSTQTAYAILESTSIGDLFRLEEIKKHHAELMESYRGQKWEDCQRYIALLTGAFNGELDSFYQSLETRITEYMSQDPDPTWTAVVTRN